MDFIFGLSIVCATLFGLLGLYLIFTEKGNKAANKILGVFFLLWAVDFFEGTLLLRGFYLENPHLALWTESFLFLYGPFIYFYTLYSIDDRRKFKGKYLLHFGFFALGFIIFLKIYHLQPVGFKLKILTDISAFNQPIESFIGIAIIYAHFFLYLFLSSKKLKTATQNFENHYSYRVLRWLKKLLLAITMILILSIASSILQFLGAKIYFNASLILILLLMGVLVGRLIFKTLEQKSPMLPVLTEKKYAGSDLKGGEAAQIESEINRVLKKEEFYLDPELSLEQLSEKVGIPKRKVSQVINERMGKSFFDLINTHRIERAKRIFKENKDSKLTVLEVLYEVGFNSKSSFNTQFKKKNWADSFRIPKDAFLRS